jgi:hypothetical protein
MKNVKADYGCIGDGITLDLTNFQNCVNAVAAAGGGDVFAPQGNYNLSGGSGLSVPDNVRILGEGRNSTILQAWHTDQPVVTVSGSRPGLERLSIYGKGTNEDSGSFGASQNALNVSSVDGVFRDILVWGGNFSIFSNGTDNYFENIFASLAYSNANVATNGANWYVRCKFDQVGTGLPLSQRPPFPAWANNTSYTTGQVVVTQGYAIQCKEAGRTGSSAPTLRNYGLPFTDGTVTWLLLAPASYCGLLLSGACGENHLIQTDFSGDGYTNSVVFTPSGTPVCPPVTVLTDCVLSHGISLSGSAEWFCMRGCEIGGGDIALNPSYSGACTIEGNFALGTTNIVVADGVSRFNIANNLLANGQIYVTSGASDHYTIVNNINCSVCNHGSGPNQFVSGNVG